MTSKVAILGGGSFGTALAIHLAPRVNVNVWEFVKEQAEAMEKTRVCPLLPDAKIPEGVKISNDLATTVKDAEFIFLVVPSQTVATTMKNAAPHLKKDAIITLCSKGLDKNSESLISEVIAKEWKGHFAVICGPTHAEEVCHHIKTIAVVASKDENVRKSIRQVWETPEFLLEESDDVVGVQLCSSLKNCYAIWMGVIDGLKQGDNTRALVTVFALREMKHIAKSLGARAETIDGPAGIGDFFVTCFSQHSRNRYLGEQLGKGVTLKDAIASMKMIAEGVPANEVLLKKINNKSKAPFLEELGAILQHNKDRKQALADAIEKSILR